MIAYQFEWFSWFISKLLDIDEPVLCEGCLKTTHTSIHSMHKLLEFRNGRWISYNMVVDFGSIRIDESPTTTLKSKFATAWTLSGSFSIRFSYEDDGKGTQTLMKRAMELGFCPATTKDPRKRIPNWLNLSQSIVTLLMLGVFFSFHLLDMLVSMQRFCKINETDFAELLQSIDGREVKHPAAAIIKHQKFTLSFVGN